MLSSLDRLIVEFDHGLRAVAGAPQARRPSPAQDLPESPLNESQRRHAAALMRINHCGEVCAQALYQGQALASHNAALKSELKRAAEEEGDHLAWTSERVHELGGRVSILNPVWYLGSFALGYAAGRLGDAWNLGFLAETEAQVQRHLQGHLDHLAETDTRTRAIVETMKADEAGHARMARALGARDLPEPVRKAMWLASRLMTSISYSI